MNKEFRANISKAYSEKSATGEDFFIETVVSGLREDRDGERMSKNAVLGMVNQLKNGRVPFFGDHGRNEQGVQVYSWKNIMGVWVDGWTEGDNLMAKVKLNKANPDAMMLYNYAEADMPLGFSIGGKVEKEFDEEYEEDEE